MSGDQPAIRVRLHDLQPPLDDWRFWAVQALVILSAGLHTAADTWDILRPLGIPAFAPVGLFLIPVIFAALSFGLSGAIATTAWVTLLMAPDLLIIDTPMDRWADGIQLTLIVATALFAGHRVEREQASRHRAEQAREAYRVAEARYRALFESNLAPILVTDERGMVCEANAAACRLLGGTAQPLAGAALDALLDREVAYGLLAGQLPEAIVIAAPDGERWLRPTCAIVETAGGQLLQVVLADVTEERREQQRMKTYAAVVLQGQEDERRRIAQELHDEPMQALIHLCRQLDAVLGLAALPGAAAGRLADTRRVAEGIVADLRELARGLRPPSLDDLGLVAAVRRLLADVEGRSGVIGRLRLIGTERRLAPEAELGLFRIIQEALHNVERHAAARRVFLTIVFDPAEVRVGLSDDGVGFMTHVAPGADGGGLGLLGMRERAALLGGHLEIRSRASRGTVIRVAIPDGGRATFGPQV
jgi:PAS domain S-box-containing protein